MMLLVLKALAKAIAPASETPWYDATRRRMSHCGIFQWGYSIGFWSFPGIAWKLLKTVYWQFTGIG